MPEAKKITHKETPNRPKRFVFTTNAQGGISGCVDGGTGTPVNPSVCCNLYPDYAINFCNHVSEWPGYGLSIDNDGVINGMWWLTKPAKGAHGLHKDIRLTAEQRAALDKLIPNRVFMLHALHAVNVGVADPMNMLEILLKYLAIHPHASKSITHEHWSGLFPRGVIEKTGTPFDWGAFLNMIIPVGGQLIGDAISGSSSQTTDSPEKEAAIAQAIAEFKKTATADNLEVMDVWRRKGFQQAKNRYEGKSASWGTKIMALTNMFAAVGKSGAQFPEFWDFMHSPEFNLAMGHLLETAQDPSKDPYLHPTNEPDPPPGSNQGNANTSPLQPSNNPSQTAPDSSNNNSNTNTSNDTKKPSWLSKNWVFVVILAFVVVGTTIGLVYHYSNKKGKAKNPE